MTKVRCKMILRSVEDTRYMGQSEQLSTVTFGAVSDPTGKTEDSIYGRYTPVAEYKGKWLKSVTDKLEVGKAYYVDFTPVDEAQPQ